MKAEEASRLVVRRAVEFDRAWQHRLLTDDRVYDAAMGVVRAVRTLRAARQRAKREKR